MPISRLAPLALAAALTLAPAASRAQGNTPRPCDAATAMTASPFYLACRGAFTGNINGAASELTMLNSFFGGAWTFQASLTPSSANSGLFNTGALTGFIVLGVKTSNEYSFYLYNKASNSPSTIPWQTAGTSANANNGGAGLSHLLVYTGQNVPSGDCVSIGGACVTTVPEPTTVVLLAAGLMGVGLAAMRRRRG